MLPLSIDHPLLNRLGGAVWALNRVLERVPLLNRLATNVEVQAIRPTDAPLGREHAVVGGGQPLGHAVAE